MPAPAPGRSVPKRSLGNRYPICILAVIFGLDAAIARAESPSAEALRWWGQWRGPTANGLAPQGNPPLNWSEDSNVRWKVELPGNGLSTPIVWGDRIYILSAVPAERRADASPTSADSVADTESRADARPGSARGLAAAVVAAAAVGAADEQEPPAQPAPEDRADRRERGERRGEGERGERRGPRGGGRREAPTEPYRFTVLALDRATGKVG